MDTTDYQAKFFAYDLAREGGRDVGRLRQLLPNVRCLFKVPTTMPPVYALLLGVMRQEQISEATPSDELLSTVQQVHDSMSTGETEGAQ